MLRFDTKETRSPQKNRYFKYVFTVKLEYSIEYIREGYRLHLKPDKSNYEDMHDNIGQRVTNTVIQAITYRVPKELQKYYGIKCEIENIFIREGSVEITFLAALGGALWGGYLFAANYKKFWDGVELMKLHINKILGRLLRNDFEDMIDFSIFNEYPILPRQFDNYPSNGFLVYLICTNIVLSIIVAMLVGKAVWHYYF